MKMLTKKEMEGYFVEYNVKNELLQDDDDMLNQIFEYKFGEIDDIINEIADYNIGVYYHDLDENENKLMSSNAKDGVYYSDMLEGVDDRYKKLSVIWYVYNRRMLDYNLEQLLNNYAVDYLISNNIEVTEEEMEDIIHDFSMCNYLESLEEIVKDTIEWYRNKEE